MQIEETVVVRFVGSTLGVVNPDGIVAESLPHCFPWAHRHEVNGEAVRRGSGEAGKRGSSLARRHTSSRAKQEYSAEYSFHGVNDSEPARFLASPLPRFPASRHSSTSRPSTAER